MNWNGVILSDSGGFQVFSLIHSKQWKGKINESGAEFKSPRDGQGYTLTPESSIDIQMQIGSDILVVLDDCRKTEISRESAEESVKRTLDWAKRCKNHFEKKYGGTSKTGKLLSAVVQGANFLDLREKCAEELLKIGFDGYNFGGFLVDSKGNFVTKEVKAVADVLPDDKFKYAMGVGKPQDIVKAAEFGYTVFDTVIPTRNARHGTLYTSDVKQGFIKISNAKFSNDTSPIESDCDCEACQNHNRAYIHHMLKVGEATGMTLATIHNLRHYQRLVEKLSIS